MNIGSRVITADGRTGILKHLMIDHRWAFGHPNVITWAAVKLDGEDQIRMLIPSQLEEAPMNEDTTGGLLIQPVDETEPDPEPVPDPTEPEPEGEEADEKLEELIEFPE